MHDLNESLRALKPGNRSQTYAITRLCPYEIDNGDQRDQASVINTSGFAAVSIRVNEATIISKIERAMHITSEHRDGTKARVSRDAVSEAVITRIC